MTRIDVLMDDPAGKAILTGPDALAGRIRFDIPEFYAKTASDPFAIRQRLFWTASRSGNQAQFELDEDGPDLGIDFKGSIYVSGVDECTWEADLSNTGEDLIDGGHHTILIETSASPIFNDKSGSRTFVYTNMGWCPISAFSNGHGFSAVHVGNTYGDMTVKWKVIAHVSEDGSKLTAVALNNAIGFATHHPDWKDGVVIGCQWGAIVPGQTKRMVGKIYFLNGTLAKLRRRYEEDFA